jgi:hypothetical protein
MPLFTGTGGRRIRLECRGKINSRNLGQLPSARAAAWRWSVHIHKTPQFTRRDQGWSYRNSNKMSAFIQKSGAKFTIAGA